MRYYHTPLDSLLRRKDPLLRAFSSFSGESLGGEFVQSHIGYEWVLTQAALLQHPLMAAEDERIRREEQRREKMYEEQRREEALERKQAAPE